MLKNHIKKRPIKNAILFTVFTIISFIYIGCCEEEDNISILGEWNWAYTIESFGEVSSNQQVPYSLIELTYSSGFVLRSDLTFTTIWFGGENDGPFYYRFQQNGELIISDTIDFSSSNSDIYYISNISADSLTISTPKKNKYRMYKEK